MDVRVVVTSDVLLDVSVAIFEPVSGADAVAVFVTVDVTERLLLDE